jgi:hypothetical protein
MRLRSRYRHGLRHCDRWLIADTLEEQTDLGCEVLARDVDLWRRRLLIEGKISDAPWSEHMIRLMNMSDIYVEYQVSSTTGSPNVIRVFAKVPRAKIEAYRQAQNDRASSDTDIAYSLSELPALSRFPHPHWRSSVSYPDALPAELQECEPDFEEYGMRFWRMKN